MIHTFAVFHVKYVLFMYVLLKCDFKEKHSQISVKTEVWSVY